MTYVPLCQPCRDNSKVDYFKSCPGCQTRRRKHVEEWHKLPGFPEQPPSSLDKPKEES